MGEKNVPRPSPIRHELRMVVISMSKYRFFYITEVVKDFGHQYLECFAKLLPEVCGRSK